MKFVSVLRGINVGGNRMIKMAELKELLLSNGFSNVVTYIQSGNLIFDYHSENPQEVNLLIKKIIEENYGYDVPTISMLASDFISVFNNNPFTSNYPIEHLHAIFLSEAPNKELFEGLKSLAQEEIIELWGTVIYMKCDLKYAKVKLTNNFVEKKLKLSATTRNWKTVTKLNEMIEN